MHLAKRCWGQLLQPSAISTRTYHADTACFGASAVKESSNDVTTLWMMSAHSMIWSCFIVRAGANRMMSPCVGLACSTDVCFGWWKQNDESQMSALNTFWQHIWIVVQIEWDWGIVLSKWAACCHITASCINLLLLDCTAHIPRR